MHMHIQVRSHQLPKKQRGFEIQHDSMLLTIFSASNYGGACRNKGGVLIFDQHGPAEVKEFYAPELDQLRAIFDFRAAEKIKDQIDVWVRLSAADHRAQRQERKEDRAKAEAAQVGWKHLLVKVDEMGEVTKEDQEILDTIEMEWKAESQQKESNRDSSPSGPPLLKPSRSVLAGGAAEDDEETTRPNVGGGTASGKGVGKSMRRRTLLNYLLRENQPGGDDVAAKGASGEAGLRRGGERVTSVVFVEEHDQVHACILPWRAHAYVCTCTRRAHITVFVEEHGGAILH